MAITETKKVKRPSTSVTFFSELNDDLHTSVAAGMKPLLDSGRATKTITVSPDGLTETFVNTYDSLETFTQAENIRGTDLDCAFLSYVTNNGFIDVIPDQYKLEGIDSPFIHTIVYHFEGTDAQHMIDTWLTPSPAYSKVQSVDVGANDLTVVFRFNNAADFTENHFNDLGMLVQLVAGSASITRTLSYALV